MSDLTQYISNEAAAAAGILSGNYAAALPALVQGVQLDIGAMQAIFSKNGVSPDFFATFSFLDFLDNSTDQWKSRYANMKGWTANQRIAWYINKINTNNPDKQDAIQYSQLYGTHHNQIDDTTKVSYELANLFNQLVTAHWFVNDNGTLPIDKTYIECDLTKCPDYYQYAPITSQISDTIASSLGLSSTTIKYILYGVIGFLLYKLLK